METGRCKIIQRWKSRRKERGEGLQTVQYVKWYKLGEAGEKRRDRGGGENVK